MSNNSARRALQNLLLPLTEAQREMLAAVQFDADAARSYNLVFPFRLQGALDLEALQDALREVITRHLSLRVRIVPETEQQSIGAVPDEFLELVDATKLSPAQQQAEVERVVQLAYEFEFSPTRLLRTWLVKLDEDSNVLVIWVHHIVCDGWSTAVLFGDLGKAYQAALFGLQANLPVAGSYVGFVEDSRSAAGLERSALSLQYWKSQFHDAIPELSIPTDHQRQSRRTFRGASSVAKLQQDAYLLLKQAGAKQGCSLFVMMLGAFEIILHQVTGQTDLVVGIPVAEQATLENSHLVAHAVNTLPLRRILNPNQGLLEQLKNVRATLGHALDHQHLTFGSLVRELAIKRDISRNPLVSVTFNIDKLGQPMSLGKVQAQLLDAPNPRLSFELMVNIVDTGSDAIIEWRFNPDYFLQTTVDAWIQGYLRCLGDLAAGSFGAMAGMPRYVAVRAGQTLQSDVVVPGVETPVFAAQAMPASLSCITRVFSEVLDRQVRSASDNFFDLGGHSMMAARLVLRLKAETGLDVRLRDLFEHQTVHALALHLDRLRWQVGMRSGIGDRSTSAEEIEI